MVYTAMCNNSTIANNMLIHLGIDSIKINLINAVSIINDIAECIMRFLTFKLNINSFFYK